MSLPVHPAAELFPLIVGAEYEALVADVKANGLREPGKTVDGTLIDGRNRERACADAGVEFVTVPVDLNGDDPIAYVVSLNVKRRNLTIGQRAVAAAEAWELYGGETRGGDRSKGRARPLKGATADRLAEAFGIGATSVKEARALVQRAPDLAAKVKAGEQLAERYEEHQRREGRDKTTREAMANLRRSFPDLSEQVDGEVLALRDALAEAERRAAAEKQLRWAATMNVLDALAHFDRPANVDEAAIEAGLLDEKAAASRGEHLAPERLRRASAWAALLADELERRE